MKTLSSTLLALGIIVALLMLKLFVIMWAWHVVVVPLSNLPELNMGQAYALAVLSSLLFGAQRFTTKKE